MVLSRNSNVAFDYNAKAPAITTGASACRKNRICPRSGLFKSVFCLSSRVTASTLPRQKTLISAQVCGCFVGKVPTGLFRKKVVLGLVTSKSPKLEDKQSIISRIREAAKIVPLDRLYLSPQCGFASCEIGNRLTEEEQWAKIKLINDIAEEVWGK